jgi:hypothetical protein
VDSRYVIAPLKTSRSCLGQIAACSIEHLVGPFRGCRKITDFDHSQGDLAFESLACPDFSKVTSSVHETLLAKPLSMPGLD